MEECVFFGGRFLCKIDVSNLNQHDRKDEHTLHPPCSALDSDDFSQSERSSVADFPIRTVKTSRQNRRSVLKGLLEQVDFENPNDALPNPVAFFDLDGLLGGLFFDIHLTTFLRIDGDLVCFFW